MAKISPVSQVLLSIKQALQDELTTDSGIKFYIAPDYKKEWQAAVTATVSELPINPSPKDKEILAQLYPGDEVAISYQVVADFEFKGDGGQFMPTTEDNDYVKEFANGRGETVRVYALPKVAGFKGIIWCGALQNKKRELIDGVQGDEETVERWLSQFPFGKTDVYKFNNLFEVGGKDYWKCYPDQIFAKKVKGHWVAIGDRIICKPIEEEVPAEVKRSLGYMGDLKIRYQDRARVLSGGKRMGLKKGDVVSFDPKQCEKYDFDGKQYYLINERVVQGKWN